MISVILLLVTPLMKNSFQPYISTTPPAQQPKEKKEKKKQMSIWGFLVHVIGLELFCVPFLLNTLM